MKTAITDRKTDRGAWHYVRRLFFVSTFASSSGLTDNV